MIQVFLAKYAMQILAGILAVSVVVGGYYYWKHDVASKAVAERDSELATMSDKLIKQKTLEVQQAKDETQRRALNAISIYAQHAENMRTAADDIPDRVYIATKASGSCDTVPATSKSRSTATPGIAGSGQAELPQANIRELNKTISNIELMQLKCERLLNELE